MTSKGPEDLLWELAGNEAYGGDREPLTDERLRAYRAGKLDGEEARGIEEALAASPAGRRRLTELADVTLDAPPEAVRRRVLEAAPGGAPPVPMNRRWWLGAAAAVLMAAVLVPSLLDRSLPEELVFDVTATGRPPARSRTAADDGIPSLATTRVTIVVEPRTEARSGLDFGLYRVDGPRLKRLDLDPAVRRETGRGTVRFSALAQTLADTVPGDYEVFVAVGREGDLPAELAVASEADAADTLAANGRRRVYRQVIHLLPPIL